MQLGKLSGRPREWMLMPAAFQRILAIDPSSSCVGYAVMEGLQARDLVDGGLLKPSPRKLPILPRIAQLGAELLELVAEARAVVVVMEVSSRATAGPMIAAALLRSVCTDSAVGYLYRALESAGVVLRTVDATVWTARVRKPKRTVRVAVIYGNRYPSGRDPGGDLADAIGIGRWWLSHQPLQQRRGGESRAKS